MADLVNPYANPYLPSFVNQRPRINNPLQPNTIPLIPSYKQINSISGFEGARQYAMNQLTQGSSEIIAESDPNTARIYIVAKDQNNQIIVEGYSLIPEIEPKPITMDDLNNKMSELLDRMNKLEEEQNNGKPVCEPSGKTQRKSNGTESWPSGVSSADGSKSKGVNAANDGK